MKICVGFTGSEASRKALELAKSFAELTGAKVHVITSMEGGAGEKPQDVAKANENIEEVKNFFNGTGIDFEAEQIVLGNSPGEDIVRFAKENDIEHIFLGIEKLSRLQKLILGSTAQYIILKAPCPVTTVRSRS